MIKTDDNKNILVTCGLPYANGKAHIGHLRTYVPADIYVRSLRKMNKKVLFICGSDTHGTPISVNAEKLNISPYELVQIYHEHFKDVFNKMNINFDYYGTTDDEENYKNTTDIIIKNEQNGNIYSMDIKVAFCSYCNRYLPDRYLYGTCIHCGHEARGDECDQGCGKPLAQGELINPKCSICNRDATYKTQKHHFFKLSNFKEEISQFLKNIHGTENAINYSKEWINRELKDWCITRNLDWGIKYPNSNLVVYVWVDAPIGYISFTEHWCKENNKNINDYWKNNDSEIIHFIGGDIIYHHCIFWPALLSGANYNKPTSIIASGMVKINDKKFSKSRGYVIWVEDDYLFNNFHPDMLRYYLSSYTSHTKELNFSWKLFQEKINKELVGIFSNFIYRTLHFINAYNLNIRLNKIDENIINKINDTKEIIKKNILNFEFKKYIDNIMELASFGNNKIQTEEPWKTYVTNQDKCNQTINNCFQIVKALCILSYPVMPSKMEEIWNYLGYDSKLNHVSYEESISIDNNFKININKPKLLFEKITDEKINEMEVIFQDRMNKLSCNEDKLVNIKNKESTMNTNIINISDFEKIDIKVGTIINVEHIEKSKKLYKIIVDLNEENSRQIVSGLKKYYTVEELLGKKVCVIVNLKPVILCGIESNGMILACQDEKENVSLIIPDKTMIINNGSKIC